MGEKEALRKRIKNLKGSMDKPDLLACSHALFSQLEMSDRFQKAHTVLCYYSLPDEVFTHEFVERWKDKKTLLLPVVKRDDLELHRYTGKQDLIVGAYQIEEPAGELFTKYEQVDLALIPGVSFDKQGNRLGRGKGYYDRLLPKLSSYNIGICFGFQICEKIPCESFDWKMDAVLSEKGWILIEE